MNFFFVLLEALGLVTKAVERHVSTTGDNRDDGSPAKPYQTITRALEDAAGLAAGQALIINVTGTKPFVEPLLVLPANVTIKGPAEINAHDPGPAVKIVGTTAAPLKNVGLSRLKISGKGPYVGDGGAVLVEHADGVKIDGCELSESVAGRGGGLAILNSTNVSVKECNVHDNTAGTPATTLAGANLGGTVQVTVTLPTGGGHGGGVFVRDSDVEIVKCDVRENQAILFGGGIAISNAVKLQARVEVLDCEVTCNQVSHSDVSALAAPVTCKRADMKDPVAAAFHVTGVLDSAVSPENEAKLVALLHGMNFESGLGGGIGVRFASEKTRIARCKIGVTRAGKEGANRARRGGGVSLYIGASPRLEDNEIANNIAAGDGGGVAIDLFDPFLPPPETEAFGIKATAMAKRELTFVTGNRIHDNHAIEDGGGLYVTGAARVLLKGGVVERNRSGQDGGGIRVTYATNLYADSVTIRDNQSNVLPVAATSGGPVGVGDQDGGGGVSARNAIVHLQDCELTGNIANSFAGAAVYFASCWEGGIDGIVFPSRVINKRSTFDKTMETSYLFHTRVLRIVNCRASGNRALGSSGAGGFVYAVRSPAAGPDGILGGGEPMWVSIDGPATAIGANESNHNVPAGAPRKRGNIVIELSGRLAGGGGPLPEDRVFISGEIPAAGIAASTPTPNEHAVVLMKDATAGHDVVQAAWAGAELLHGPKPTATSVAPTLASTVGGTTLVVTGTGIEDGTFVRVGGKDAATVSHTATEVRATSPAGPVGNADVALILASGSRAILPAAVRLLAPPTITKLTPAKGAEGATVRVTGTSFVPGTKVHLIAGGTEVEADVTPVTETELIFEVPASPGPSPVNVRVTVPTGDTAVMPRGFSYTS